MYSRQLNDEAASYESYDDNKLNDGDIPPRLSAVTVQARQPTLALRFAVPPLF
jgi:hypothetical protein